MSATKLYGFATDNGTSLERGLRFLSYPVFEYGREELKEIKIAGRKGTLTINTGKWTDTVIETEMEFIGKTADDNETKKYQILQWMKGIKELSFTDSTDNFFKVKQVKFNKTARNYKIFNRIVVTFICDPGIYLRAGNTQQSVTNGMHLVNAYSVSAPIYKIRGEGMLTLTVNGKTVKTNVGQNLTIDTELKIAYREDGTMQNTALSGDYDNLILKEGDNTINVTPSFNVQIIPRWRLLL